MEENTLQPTLVESHSSEAPTLESLPTEQPQVEQLIIGEEITEEDRNRIFRRLGRPDAPDAYDLNGIVPENYNHDLVEQFKIKAHKTGMSNEGVREMAEWYKEVELKQKAAYDNYKKATADQHLLELKRDFGTKFDVEVGHAKKALDAYTDKAFKDYMNETGLGNHPALVKAFAKIGRELSEDRLVQSETAQRMQSNDDLRRQEIQRLRADKSFMDRYRRGDPVSVARLNRLYSD